MTAADPIVPLHALRRRGERFRCAVLNCVLTAGTCERRQEIANKPASRDNPLRHQVQRCADCADGRAVVRRLLNSAVANEPMPAPRPAPVPARLVADAPAAALAATPPPPTPAAPEDTTMDRETAPTRGGGDVAPAPRTSTPKPARCTEDGCAEPPARVRKDTLPGTEGLCPLHRKRARERAMREEDAAKPAKPAKPAPEHAGGELRTLLERAGEALELVDAIGWELCRALAARVRG